MRAVTNNTPEMQTAKLIKNLIAEAREYAEAMRAKPWLVEEAAEVIRKLDEADRAATGIMAKHWVQTRRTA